MVMFESWKDNYIFLRDYGTCTCLNCYYGGAEYTDDSETHTDSEYAHLFCMESVSMIRLDLLMVCAKWRDKDTGKPIEMIKEDEFWKLPNQVIDKLDEDTKRWNINEVRDLINETSID